LNKVEEFYECKIYGVLDLQEVEENIQFYGAEEDEKYSKKELIEAMNYAYNKVESSYEYEIYLETIVDYLKEIRKIEE
jgi:hypothetical protein